MDSIVLALMMFCVIFGVGSFIEEELVFPEVIEHSYEVCMSNGGVSYLEVDSKTIEIICNNGANFEVAMFMGRKQQ